MRIAYFSPLPPARSGIADYSAELLPHLSRHADITLFADAGSALDESLARTYPTDDVSSFRRRHAGFDIALYHMGNDVAHHEFVYRAMQERPGVVVVHETAFYHFFHLLTVSRGDVDGFRRLLETTYGQAQAGRAMAQLDDWERMPLAFPLLAPVLSNALGAIAHSEYARRHIQRCRPDLPMAVVPHHLSLPAPFDGPVDRAAIRAELGLAGHFVVGSFGYVTPSKRPAVLLRAFARFRQHHPEAICCLVGEASPGVDLARLIAEAGCPAESVRITGHLPMAGFLRHMAATDVAVNLRHPTSGETSGSVIRLLGLGVPTVVSDVGSFAEFPADVCATVPVDSFEEDTLFAILQALAGDDHLRRALGDNARRHVGTHHTLAGSAQAYAEFLEQVATGRARPVGRPATWPATRVMSDIGATLAGWGLTGHHDALLHPIAAALSDLGIAADRPARP